MENKNKLFGYVPSLSEFNNLKVSADIENKTYTIGGGSVQQCAEGEVPDVRWHIVVFIEDVTRIWTHGKFYASANAKLSDDYQSPVYVEVKDLETGEVLFNPAKPGETIEEAILQLDTNVANLLAEILKNEEVVSTALNELNLSSGFNDNGKYIQQTTSKYISGATSLADADNLLDSAISSIAANVEALSGDLSGLFIPTKTSDLTNDSGYITIGDVESKNYITSAAIPTKVSAFENDAKYITSAAIPTNVTAFTNDAGYITSAAIPANVSAFNNDAKYQTESDVKAAIDGLINGAPGTLDTLGEIAEILSENTDGIGALVEELAKKANTTDVNAALDNKADKTTVNDLSETVDDVKDALDSITGSTNNVYTANGSAQYINTATSLKDADDKLDAAIAGVASELSNLSTEVSKIEIPTKVSAFTNDAKYAYQGDIPTKVSQLENDSKYLTSYYVPAKVSEFENDANYATKSEIPTKLGQLTNDADYAKVSDIPTSTSQLTNNSGFITMSDVEAKKYITIDQVPEVSVPQNLSQYNNDAGFITISDVEEKNYATKAELPEVPTNISAFTNDAGYITSADVPEVSKDLSQYDNTTSKFVSESELTNKNYTTMSEVEAKGYITLNDVPEVDKDLSQYDNTTSKFVSESELEAKDYATKAELPTIPTKLSAFENDCAYMTVTEVEAKVASLVDSAPETLDTLNELAAALGDDPNFATTISTEIGKKADLTYVTSELEKKANSTVAGEFDVYPVLKNTHTGEELFVNCHDGIAVSDAIHNIDKNTYTLVGEILKNEEVISNAFNKINTSAGFDENANFVVKENANVIGEATNLTEAVNILDTTVGELANELNSINIALSDEYQSAVYPDDLTSGEFVAPVAGDDLDTAIGKLDTNVATLVDETLKIEETVSTALNRLNKSAGFDVNGIYHPAEDANVIGEATSLKEAVDLLDENLVIESDGAYFPIVRDITTEEEKYLFSYLYAGDSIKDAIYKTDSNVATLAYEVVRNEYVVSAFAYQINNSVGLNEHAEYTPKSSANYISDAKSLVDADNKLDAAIKSANDSIDSLNNDIINIHIPSTVAELTDSSDYYTKSELTRVSQLYNDSEYQRKPEVESIVSAYIANVVNSAPAALDTLNELAIALGNDENFATNVTNQIASKANNTISYDGAKYPEVDDINSETEGTTYIFVNTYEGTSLEQYVRNVDDNVARLVQECLDTEFVVSSALNQFNISAGFDEQVKYVQNASAQYINSAASLADADNLLDSAISAVANSVSSMRIPTTVAELTDAGNYAKKTEVPTVPTNVSAFTNDANYATTTYVASELAKLVNSAPDTLNTLDELAAALGDDANFATTVTNQIASKANKTITGDSVKYREIQDINNPGTYFFINSYDGIELEQFVRNVDANTATLVNEVCKNEQVISTAINQLNVSSGFGEDAKYAPNTTATYISSATSLVEADNMLDSAISDVYSALDNYATKTEVSAKADNVLGSDYVAVEYQKIVNVNNTETEEVLFDPVVAGDTIANAIKKLDQNISTLVDETVKNELVVATAVNVLNESCGFGTNAKYVQYTGGYAIADAKSLYAAILALDAKLQAVATAAGVSI